MERTTRFRVEREDPLFLNPLPGWLGGFAFVLLLVLNCFFCRELIQATDPSYEALVVKLYPAILILVLSAYSFSRQARGFFVFALLAAAGFGPLAIYLLFARTPTLFALAIATLTLFTLSMLPFAHNSLELGILRVTFVIWSTLTALYNLGRYTGLVNLSDFPSWLYKLSFARQLVGAVFILSMVVAAIMKIADMPPPSTALLLQRPRYLQTQTHTLGASLWEPFNWVAYMIVSIIVAMINFAWQLTSLLLSYLYRLGREIANTLWQAVFVRVFWLSFLKSMASIILIAALVLSLPLLLDSAARYLQAKTLSGLNALTALGIGYFGHVLAVALLCLIWLYPRYRDAIYRCQLGASIILIGFGVTGILLFIGNRFGPIAPAFSSLGIFAITFCAVVLLAIVYQIARNTSRHELR